jgi:ceramide glucosyltransferase
MEIFYIFFCITILGLTGYGFQLWAIRKTLNGKTTEIVKGTGSAHEPLPPVSVLKPLKGLDDNLFDNLESICRQEYPAYEVIFSLQDYNDPAYKVARKIKDKYPEHDITILAKRCEEGLNPKVNNLIPAYRIAKYEHILISDSNVMVDGQYLQSIIRHMADPDVGLVSNMIKGVGGCSIGSIFENLHLNTFVMGSVCFLDRFLKMPCVVGKSMLMKKTDLNAMGGLKAFKDVLAEDYLIGKKMQALEKKVVLSTYLIRNINVYWGVRRFLNRHTRWGKLRWKIGGVSYFSELIGNPVFMSCLPVLAGELSRVTVSFAVLVSSLKIFGDMYIGRVIAREDKASSPGERELSHSPSPWMNPLWYFLSPVKDLLVGLIWFVPLFSNTVVWRENRYIIGKDSLLSPCPENGFWSLRYRLADAIKTRFA